MNSIRGKTQILIILPVASFDQLPIRTKPSWPKAEAPLKQSAMRDSTLHIPLLPIDNVDKEPTIRFIIVEGKGPIVCVDYADDTEMIRNYVFGISEWIAEVV